MRFNLDFNISNTLFTLIKELMKKEIRLNTIVWLLLVILIIVSTFFAENGLTAAYILIPLLSIIKFLSVVFQFVEVKHAHPVWKVVSILFVVVYFAGILVLY